MQIRSPNDGTKITQEQDYLLVSGKVASGANRSPLVDILVLDVSGSTASYAGVDFPEFSQLPNFYISERRPRRLLGPWCPGKPGPHSMCDSILAAEIVASHRLLPQLNPETTRVGVIIFSGAAWLRQPLTHNFDEVRQNLDLIYKRGPSFSGTNMEAAIRAATNELLGEGQSEKYLDSIKQIIFLTDGFPTLPTWRRLCLWF